MNDNTVYSYINDIAQRLKEPRKYGDVSLMIGAGFSKNAQSKGMASMQPPNWSELAEKMYEELYPEPLEVQEKEEWNKQRIIKTSGKNVTKLADEYIANFDRNKINNSNFAHRFCLCTLKIQYLAGIRLSKFTLCPMPPEAVSSTKQAMCS